jgi:hypothetical protein
MRTAAESPGRRQPPGKTVTAKAARGFGRPHRTGTHCLTWHTGAVKRGPADGTSAPELSEGSDHECGRQ